MNLLETVIVKIILCFCIFQSTIDGAIVRNSIPIAGLFDISDPYEEIAFRHGAVRVNADTNAFPIYELEPRLQNLQTGDSYNASNEVCRLLKEGIGGVIGPQSATTVSYVQSACEVLHVPRIETKWDFREAFGDYIINLYPDPYTLSTAYANVIEAWGWKDVIVIYENNESLFRLQGIFNLTGRQINKMVVKQLPEGDDFRPLMKELRKKHSDITRIVIDCHSSKLPKLFKDASEQGVTNHNYAYFLTTLDIHTVQSEAISIGDVNITAVRLVNPENPKVKAVVTSWKQRTIVGEDYFREDPFYLINRASTRNLPKPIPLRNDMLKTETALMYDAMELFAMAYQKAVESENPISLESLDCDARDVYSWSHGATLVNYMKGLQVIDGLSGIVNIDPDGKRRMFKLDVMELTKKNLTPMGEWKPYTGYKTIRSQAETERLIKEDLKGSTLQVTMKISPPYCMQDDPNNGTCKGFAVDLLAKLAKNFEFKYEIHIVKDKKMGSPTNDSLNYRFGWDGMIGEILEGTADIAIGDMSITSQRGEVVDFTLPFMNLGISILYKKPPKKATKLFQFLDPFHIDVWIYMVTAYLSVSLILFILARITPFEWINPHPCDENPEELELNIHLINSLWFTIGSLMQQGSDIAPRAASTRMIAGIWWFFTLIIMSSYTANLAAVLTSEGLEEGIKDVKDLPKQTKVKYGTMGSGTTKDFFKDSPFPLYKEIYKNMINMRPEPFVASTTDGVNRVKKSDGKYAFFMESVSIEYQTERDCTLVQLGGLLDSKGYGIALKKGSKFLDSFNKEILSFSELGVLDELKKRWWKEEGGGLCKTEVLVSGGATALGIAHVGGVFVVLVLGCVGACFMAVIEFLWKARKLARLGKKSFWTEIKRELKLAFLADTKPVNKSTSLNPSTKGETTSNAYMPFNGNNSVKNEAAALEQPT